MGIPTGRAVWGGPLFDVPLCCELRPGRAALLCCLRAAWIKVESATFTLWFHVIVFGCPTSSNPSLDFCLLLHWSYGATFILGSPPVA